MDAHPIPQTRPLAHVRVRPRDWLAIGFMLLFCEGLVVPLALTVPHSATSLIGVALIALLALTPALIVAAMVLWIEVIADEEGLRWRRWFKWRQCRWGHVTDYYEQSVAGHTSPRRRLVVIETTLGKIRLPPRIFDVTGLKTVVQTRASHAKATNWDIYGTRSVDPPPREFKYRTAENSSVQILTWVFVPLIAAGYLYLVVDAAQHIAIQWQVSWIYVALDIAFLALMLAVAWPIVWILLSGSRAVARRRDQRIMVSHGGISYWSSGQEIEATWDQITDYYVVGDLIGPVHGHHLVVETTQGRFDYTHQICDFLVLSALVERYAAHVPHPGWHVRDGDEIFPRGSARTANGTQRYGYRTRFLRASLWGPTTIAVAILIVLAFERYAGVTAASPVILISFSIALLLLSAWGWWCYFRSCVAIDEDGITKYGPISQTRILWRDITEYYETGADLFVFDIAAAGDKKISFWFGIARARELKAEIARRAVNSYTKEWEHRQPRRRANTSQN